MEEKNTSRVIQVKKNGGQEVNTALELLICDKIHYNTN